MTPKQTRFVAEYLADNNATQAAIRAGYSEKSAKVIGCENLTKPDIAAAIAAGTKKTLDTLEVTKERVLEELARLAFGDLRGLVDEDGNLKPLNLLDDDAARMVSSIEVLRQTITTRDEVTKAESIHKVRTWDKLGALNTLAKHLKLLTDKVEIHSRTLEEMILESYQEKKK